ncbi:MAG: dCTP deaminase [Thermofilum sp. ex4484_82]|nr:dCTP deaminase [Thermoproteales archaeon]OYT26059.1 MAG: dCTP deaminase [Thermofilum sp. ex4484_82]OYT36725.1 MAG: dCTP deaminase [Archaeoglobales archaeon ex4484_92]RLE77961.1 MAG: dCTP deaminase [Thermoprotei archaeon]
MLSGREILKLIKKGELAVNPLDASIIRENGIDLRIGNEVAVLINNPNPLDPEKLGEVNLEEYFKVIKIEDSFVLQPYMKILVTTLEYIKMPINVGGLVELRSTFARLGLSIPPTVIDAGFKGQITLEVHGGAFPVVLKKGVRFAHIVFMEIKGEPVPYRGRYQEQRGVTLPR